MNNYFGKNLRYLRKERGLSQENISKLLGYKSYTTIQKWEDGTAEPNLGTLSFLADYFNVNLDDLIHIDLSYGITNISPIPTKPVSYVPSTVAAGIPETIEGYQDLPKIEVPELFLGKYSNRKDLLMMKVNGESMNKIIKSGSYIAVITDIEVENLKEGDLVVFNHEYQYSLKHYHDLGDKILFKPNSTDLSFTDLVIDKENDLDIVGKVIMYNVNLD